MAEGPYKRFAPSNEWADAQFYSGYDPNFVCKKVEALFVLYSHQDAAQQFIQALGGHPEALDADYFHALAAGIHCSVFHQCEALVALLLAEYQPWPDWAYLTAYPTKEVKDATQAIKAGNFSDVSGGNHKTAEEFVSAAAYAGWAPADAETNNEWQGSLSDLGWFVRLCATEWCETPEYNAYKLGLRLLSGPSYLAVKSSPSTQPGEFQTVLSMPESIAFLKVQLADRVYRGELVTKKINPHYSIQIIRIASGLLETIRHSRLARAANQTPDELRVFRVDRDAIMRFKPVGGTSISY